MERDYYKAAGVDPAERKSVEKSARAHRASFEGTAKGIIEVDTRDRLASATGASIAS